MVGTSALLTIIDGVSPLAAQNVVDGHDTLYRQFLWT
jgi:hypothetical protein